MKKLNIKIRKCRRCKTPIHENALREYCDTCYKIVEKIFNKIRTYLEEYPGATAYEMNQRLGIPIHVINNFVRDGRLIEIPNEHLNIECLRCGNLLLSAYHKYCPVCEVEMKRDLKSAKEELSNIQNKNIRNKSKESGGMHLDYYLRKK